MEYREDEYYIGRVLDGNTDAYGFLVEKHKNLAFTIALRIAGNREDAEEIAQDAFVKVYRSLKNFRGKAKFTTWLYRIVYNTAVSKVRIKKRYVPIDEAGRGDIYEKLEKPEEEVSSEKERKMKALEKAMEVLPDDEKILVQLYYYSETPVKELAKVAGISQANVKVKLFRARKKLYEEIQRNNEIYA